MKRVSIFAGSVYGNAQHVAEQVAECFTENQIEAKVFEDPIVDDFINADAVLVITSTTGQGDIPPNLEFFHNELRDQLPLMNNKPFAVAALGDSSYGETFCGGGRQFFELLLELQGSPVAEMLEVDAIETLEPETEVVAWAKGLADKLTS